MKLINLSIILFVLVVRPCLGKLVIATSNLEITTSGLVKDMGNILKRCYGDQVHGVGLVGNLPSTLSRTLSGQHSIPIVVVNRRMKSNNMPRIQTNDFRYKLHVFVIECYSEQQLDNIIGKTMKSSVWWNHMASFFILDLSYGCRMSSNFLLLAWKNDMLNAKVMCRPPGWNESIIVNYNPFTSQAPVSWQRIHVLPGINKHPFTLFVRKYQENETICPDENFDKTKDLGGYTIRLQVREQKRTKVAPGDKKREPEEFHIIRQNIVKNIYRALNANVTYSIEFNEWKRITNTDMIAHTVRITNDIHKTMSYPIASVGRNIVTRFRNREPRRFYESFAVRDSHTRYSAPVLYLIALFLFRVFEDQALIPLLLNLTRVIYNTRFRNLLNFNPMRVYLTDVAFFLVMIQAIFYAHLIHPLTKQIPLRNVETVEDLGDLGYTTIMIGFKWDKQECQSVGSFPDKVFEMNSVVRCFKLLQNSSSIACMNDLYFQLDLLENFNLHLNRQLHIVRHEGFPIRSNWPLEECVNAMLARSVEANVLEPWYLKLNSVRSRIWRKGELDRNNMHVESIKLHEITFMFTFLCIGHMCATLVFMIELLCSHKYLCRIRLIRRHWVLTVKNNRFVSLTSTPDWTV